MTAVQKFYLLDATTTNTGTMPSGAFLGHPHVGAGTDATGAETCRTAGTSPGTSNPDIDATATAAANQISQTLEIRRFVSAPLAACTLTTTSNTFSWTYASGCSNTNHNGSMTCEISVWRPSTGTEVVGERRCRLGINTAMTATAETVYSNDGGSSAFWGTTGVTLQDGDILVFEVYDQFTQSMSQAYTTFFSYDGTTESSTTTCASFVDVGATPLTLFDAGGGGGDDPPRLKRIYSQLLAQ